jgi:hemoglobin
VAPSEETVVLMGPTRQPIMVDTQRTSAGVRPDLTSRKHIHDLVVGFYRELIMDEVLGQIFEEVAEVDWSKHIPLLIDYWCRVLLGHQTYRGAILVAHRHVHDQQAFTADHFDRWYRFWVATIDQTWAGPSAEKAKSHAARVGGSLARQLPRIAWEPTQGTTCPIAEGMPVNG